MITSELKFILCILFLDYAYTNSIANVNENMTDLFTGGYEYYENLGFYKLYSLPSTWAYAWKQCLEDGAHLVVVDSEEEHEVVWDMMEQSNADAFIGVHDFFFEGSFFTITGEPLVPSSYNKWSKDEPNNYYVDQDCVLMARNGELWVGKCDRESSFICEFELNQKQCN